MLLPDEPMCKTRGLYNNATEAANEINLLVYLNLVFHLGSLSLRVHSFGQHFIRLIVRGARCGEPPPSSCAGVASSPGHEFCTMKTPRGNAY